MEFHSRRLTATCGGLMLCFAVAVADAQGATDPSASTDTAQIQQELAKLREQVRQLQQRVQSSGSGSSMSSRGMEMDMMKMKDKTQPKMRENAMMGMGAMGGMNSPAAMATPSGLPGFPGQSHLYHIGATGFFLDHPEHITLTTQQQQTLAQHKQQSLLKQGELQRQIDTAEQELWQLTGTDQPQIGTIDKKVREIERLRGDQRIAFIRTVGEAAKALTDKQRQQLTGSAPAQPMTDSASMPMSDSSKPNAMDHM